MENVDDLKLHSIDKGQKKESLRYQTEIKDSLVSKRDESMAQSEAMSESSVDFDIDLGKVQVLDP